MVKEVVRWHGCGQDVGDRYIIKNFGMNEIKYISYEEAIEIYKLKGFDIDKLDYAEKYGLFYNYHPSSGYRTEINTIENIAYFAITEEPKGFVLSAFHSEGILFECQ